MNRRSVKDQAEETNLGQQKAGSSDATLANAAATTVNVIKTVAKEPSALSKIVIAVEKINETNRETVEKQQKTILLNRTLKYKTDKKEIAALSKMFQSKLESLQDSNRLDLEDSETCELVIFLLQKPIKTAQEVSFLGKFMKGLSLFSQREELFQAQQLSSKLIQNLRCVHIPKQVSLFRYGDRGHEYFILLKGKAYCLVPYSNLIPMDQINTQTKNNRLLNQVIEDEEDEEFLFDHFPRHQCVKIYHPGEAFGEIALLTSESKRMASIVCKEDSWFMSLDREGFTQIQVNKILSFLHETSEASFLLGQSIYEQNDKLQNVYFIMEGEVELTYRVSQSFPSRLDNQKYEKYFLNTKTCNLMKEIVILSRGNYFGDEDLFCPGLRRSFSAAARSQVCKLMVVDSRSLVQFLKVSERFQILKNTASSKRERYMEIVAQFNKEHAIQADNSRDSSRNNRNDRTKDDKSKENKNSLKTTEAIAGSFIAQSPFENPADLANLGIANSTNQEQFNEGMSKYHNLYTQQGNANMRTKNYLSLHSAHNNTCKFTINDMPMTMTMNQHPNDLKKIQFRLKNKQISALGHEQPLSHHSFEQQSKLKIAESLVKHTLNQPETDFAQFPQIYSMITQQNEEYQFHVQQQPKQEQQEPTKQQFRLRQASIEQNLIRHHSVIQEPSETTPRKELRYKLIARTSLSPQLKIQAEYSINHRNQNHLQEINADPYYEPKQQKSSSFTSSSRILGQLTKKILKSSETVSKLFEQSAWNLSSASKHSQNFLSYLSTNLINKKYLNTTNTTIDNQAQDQEQQQTSLPLIKSPLKSQKSLGKRASLQLNHSHFFAKNSHLKDSEAVTSPARISPSSHQEYQMVQKPEGEIRKSSHIRLRKAYDVTTTSSSSLRKKLKRFNFSPEKYAMQHSVSITSNEYQQNLLLKKHFSLIEQD